MFSYYGSKSKLVDLYPAPKHGKVIEPFAGSARYALKYFDRDVLIVDAYDVVIKIWQYLQLASEKDILGLPDLTYKQSTADYNLSEGERLLLGFLVARGSRRPAKVVQKFSSVAQDKIRIAKDLYKIRHWKIQQGDYKDIPNDEATWFIDPPYQNVGKAGYNVNERGKAIDFPALGEWCKSRNGQAIVCEVTTADWLPFEPLKKQHGQKLFSTEAIWCNDNWSYQQQLFTPSNTAWSGLVESGRTLPAVVNFQKGMSQRKAAHANRWKDSVMDETDRMQEQFCFIYGEPVSRHDPDWLTSFGLFAKGWEYGKAFQQSVQLTDGGHAESDSESTSATIGN